MWRRDSLQTIQELDRRGVVLSDSVCVGWDAVCAGWRHAGRGRMGWVGGLVRFGARGTATCQERRIFRDHGGDQG